MKKAHRILASICILFVIGCSEETPTGITPVDPIDPIPIGRQKKEATQTMVLEQLPSVSKQYKIGVLFPMLASPFWVNESYGIMNQADELGVEIIWYSADGYANVDKQNSQIEDLITQKVDGIIIAPTSYQGNTPAIEKAISAGIPVVVHVTGTSASGISGSILADDLAIGRQQAKFLNKALGGEGKVIMLSGPSGADWSTNRAIGFKEELESLGSQIEIVAERTGEPDRASSQRIVEDLLIRWKDVDGIYTAADGMAIGVAISIKQLNTEGQVLLTTASFSRETVEYIRNDQIHYNVDENPVMQGRAAVNALVYCLEGYTIPKKILVPIPGIDKSILDSIDLTNQWAPLNFSPVNN